MLGWLLGLLLGTAAAASAALAVALAPPVLGRWLLASGPLTGRGEQALGWFAAAAAFVAALLLLRGARGCRRRAFDPALRSGVVVALATFAAGAVLLEVAARLLVRAPAARRELLLPPDEFWRTRFIALHVEADPDDHRGSLFGAGNSLHVADPRLGWAPRPGHRGVRGTVNALGLRDVAEVTVEKPEGQRRIVVLGDSFTFGKGVADHEVWTVKLEAALAGRLPEVEPTDAARVLNLGVMGYGLDQQVLRLEELGLRLAPDLVLLAIYGPDLERNELSFRDAAKPRFELDPDPRELRYLPPPPLPPPGSTLADAANDLPASFALAIFRRAVEATHARLRCAPRWHLARSLLDRARHVVHGAGAHLVIAYFPERTVAAAPGPDGHEKVVVDWAAERGVEVINLRHVFRALGPDRHAGVWREHWTPFGHEVVGAAVADALGAADLTDFKPLR